jgi:hypothetical protein
MGEIFDRDRCKLRQGMSIRSSILTIRLQEIRNLLTLGRKHMAHNHGSEYQVQIVHEDGTEELSGTDHTCVRPVSLTGKRGTSLPGSVVNSTVLLFRKLVLKMTLDLFTAERVFYFAQYDRIDDLVTYNLRGDKGAVFHQFLVREFHLSAVCEFLIHSSSDIFVACPCRIFRQPIPVIQAISRITIRTHEFFQSLTELVSVDLVVDLRAGTSVPNPRERVRQSEDYGRGINLTASRFKRLDGIFCRDRLNFQTSRPITA